MTDPELTISELENRVGRDLPTRWELCIKFQNGAASVNLYDPLGEPVRSLITDDTDSLQMVVMRALEHARVNDGVFS